MTELQIDSMHARIAAVDAAHGARVATLHAGIADGVATALRHRLGPDDELVLIRTIHVPVTVGWGATDLAIQAAWTAAIASHLADLVEQPDNGEAVVRYASEQAAVVDALHRLAAGDIARAWAWQLAGLCPQPDSETAIADGLVSWLEARPGAIANALNAVARAGRLGILLVRLGRSRVGRLERAIRLGPSGPTGGAPAAVDAATVGGVAIARALRTDPVLCERADELIPTLALIGARLMRPVGTLPDSSIALVGSLLRAGLPRGGARPGPVDPDPGRAGRAPHDDPGPTDLDGSGLAGPAARAPITSSAAPVGEHPSTQGPADRSAAGTTPEEPAPTPSALPPVLVSGHAGLLYALNILADSEAGVALPPGLPGRPTTWTMWHLGATLAGSASDPAVALFAGRMPADGPPGSLPDGSPGPGSSPSPAEADAITRAAELVGLELARRTRAEGAPDAIVRRVVDRTARIEAVDGWADVSFDLDAIDLDIRIAGLDRDPGFVPLLGTVVRFHYV